MPNAAEEPAAALLRLLAARRGCGAVGLIANEPAGPKVVAETAAFKALRGGTRPPGPGAEAQASAGEVDPAAFGLRAGFAAAAPVGGAGALGWVVVAGPAPRRLSQSLLEALLDAAALARPLFALPPAVRSGLRLRAAAQRMIDTALARRGEGRAALMMLDIDRFRSVNEALGMPAGDTLLAVIGTRLVQTVGSAGRLVRLDGDRFVIVVSPEPADLRTLARRLLQAVSQPLLLDGRTLTMQASIGAVSGVTPELPTPMVLLQADTALRRAKAEGRNRVVLHEPSEAVAARESSRLELDLGGALSDGQLRLAYQPFVDLRDGRVSGAEALLRWRHPTRGDLLPASFIPLAEATGQILPLGQWALRTALATARSWPAPLCLAVNISPLQFHQPSFLADVDAALAETRFPPERLELEITETVLLRDNPDTTDQLRALIARGIRIALDDFGTGYSALAYLARLPHHRIKLDKAFVQDLGNPATAELIRAIIALAGARGVAVTAEGVERPEHLAVVRRMGFTHAQGYAIGAPQCDPSRLGPMLTAVS
jgi:diguanylate cyclase (GGDEF)-like protein